MVDDAIRTAEETGRGAFSGISTKVDDVVRQADASAMAQADGIAHGADYGCEDMAHYGAVAAASAAYSAELAARATSLEATFAAVLDAARYAVSSSRWDPLEDRRSVVESREIQRRLTAAQVADDLQRLHNAARIGAWRDTTPVPPEFFEATQAEPRTIIQAIAGFSNQLATMIAENPNCLEEIEWRDLERLLARIFSQLGFNVDLQPGAKDGGKDIVLEFFVKGEKKSYAVQVKHWRSGKMVGKGHIESFLQVLAREKHDGGLYMATGGFSPRVVETIAEIGRERLILGGREKVISLCRTFVRARQGLWHPTEPLVGVLTSQ